MFYIFILAKNKDRNVQKRIQLWPVFNESKKYVASAGRVIGLVTSFVFLVLISNRHPSSWRQYEDGYWFLTKRDSANAFSATVNVTKTNISLNFSHLVFIYILFQTKSHNSYATVP